MKATKEIKMSSEQRKISRIAVSVGSVTCLLGAIWYPQDAIKWVATSLYLSFVGRNFGLTYANEKVVGSKIKRDLFLITNFINMRKK